MKKALCALAALSCCSAVVANHTHQQAQHGITPFVGIAAGYNSTDYAETRTTTGLKSRYGGDGWLFGGHVGAVFYKHDHFSLAANVSAYAVDSKHATSGRSSGDRTNKLSAFYAIELKPGYSFGDATLFLNMGYAKSRYQFKLEDSYDQKFTISGSIVGVGAKMPVTDRLSAAVAIDYIFSGHKTVDIYQTKPKGLFGLVGVDYSF